MGVPTAPTAGRLRSTVMSTRDGHGTRYRGLAGEQPSCVSSEPLEPPRAQAEKGRCARGQESPDVPPGGWGGDGSPARLQVRGGKCHRVLGLGEWTRGLRKDPSVTFVLQFPPSQSSDRADGTPPRVPHPPPRGTAPQTVAFLGCWTWDRPRGWRSWCHQAGRGSALGVTRASAGWISSGAAAGSAWSPVAQAMRCGSFQS